MKTLIVYYSKFGNTHRLADVIAESLKGSGDVKSIEFDQLSEKVLDQLDLLVMGSPTHNMNLPKKVKPILDRVPRGSLAGISAAVFDTSYEMSWLLNQFTASKRLAKTLRKKGAKLVAPPEIFLVTGREGPIQDGEIKRAREWGGRIIQKSRV
jgi:flavodoxin